MKGFEVMTLELVSIPAGASVRDGTSFMRWLGLGPVRVCEAGRLLGMLPSRGNDDVDSPSRNPTSG